MQAASNFEYRGCHFSCEVLPTDSGAFSARVEYLGGLASMDRCVLPHDADPYRTAPEAQRHAHEQAMRWAHDRTGDGRGQF